jgi:glucan biosynthesis protein C
MENEMNQHSLQPTDTSPAQAAPEKPSRLFFIDHLRAALVILVVLHHLAVVYGEGISFYYVEPPSQDSLTYLLLLIFVLGNQAWFMGALFLLAGYFTPGSYERKGPGSFLKDRLVRLGIPLVIFYFVLNPISAIGLYLEPAPRIPGPLTWQSYLQTVPYLFGLGPLWFVAMLLIFAFGYVAWRGLAGNRVPSPTSKPSLPGYLPMGIFILALAVVSYLVRIVVPLGKFVFDFPTLAYLPQYLSFFILGTVASRRDWFRNVPRSMGIVGFVAVVVSFVFLFLPALFGGQAGEFLGNGHWQSALYVLWDSITAVGMCLAVIPLFRRFFNKQGKFGRFLSQHGYAVFIIHSPIIVFVAAAFKGFDVGNIVKFGITAVITVPVSFALAYIIRKIPGVSRIL